jgi:hypothetical protein
MQRCERVDIFAEGRFSRFTQNLCCNALSVEQKVRRQIYSFTCQLSSEPKDASIRAMLIKLRDFCVSLNHQDLDGYR